MVTRIVQGFRTLKEDGKYVELVHGYPPGPVTVTRVTFNRNGRLFFKLEGPDGRSMSVLELERMLTAPDLAELRVHDGVNSEGECDFWFRGFSTRGRFV